MLTALFYLLALSFGLVLYAVVCSLAINYGIYLWGYVRRSR